MQTLSTGDVDLEALRASIAALRARLPPGTKIAVIGSIRTRDRAAVAAGEVFPLALASPLLFDQQWGQHVRHTAPHIQIFQGMLGDHHTASLLPVLEQAARQRVDVVIAASEIDESILALFVLNKQRNTLRVCGLLAGVDGAGLAALARAIGVKVGVAGDQLVVEAPGTAHTLLATPHETILLLDPRTNPKAPPLGLLFIGGGDSLEIRLKVDAARALLAAGA